MSLLAICISYLERYYVGPLLNFELRFWFLLLSCLYISEIKPLSIISFVDIFFHSALFFSPKIYTNL